MLSNVHLAPSDDEDLYSGFGNEEVAPALQTEDLEFDEGFQVSSAKNSIWERFKMRLKKFAFFLKAALKSSHGRRPPGTASGRVPTAGRLGTAARMGTASGMRGATGVASSSMGGRPITGMADGVNRPMTGIRGAGYPGTAGAGGRGGAFDPLNQVWKKNLQFQRVTVIIFCQIRRRHEARILRVSRPRRRRRRKKRSSLWRRKSPS